MEKTITDLGPRDLTKISHDARVMFLRVSIILSRPYDHLWAVVPVEFQWLLVFNSCMQSDNDISNIVDWVRKPIY